MLPESVSGLTGISNKPLNLLEKILINHQDTNYLYTMS